jgi:cobalamin biosynthetic protein CobC
LARRGVWTRLFTPSGSVRFGLPADEVEWARFEQSLRDALREIAG